MSHPKVVLLDSWPQPDTSTEVRVVASETQLLFRYVTGHDETAIVRFPLVDSFHFGAPNDEALEGHPLVRFGLKLYQVHRIESSLWIAELEKRNSVHPRHEKNEFLKNRVHYIFTFKDSTLECVVCEGQFWKPKVQLVEAGAEAEAAWMQQVAEVLS